MYIYDKKRVLKNSIITFYIIGSFILSLFFLFSKIFIRQWNVEILYLVFNLIMLTIYIISIYRKKIIIRRTLYRIDIFIILNLIINFAFLVFTIFQGKEFKVYLYGSIFSLVYFMISGENEINNNLLVRYLDYFLSVLSVFYIILFYITIVVFDFNETVNFLTQENEGILSFLLLGTLISIVLFCKNKVKKKNGLYFLNLIAGFYFLFFIGDVISIILIATALVILLLLFTPTGDLVKKNILLFFAYLFFAIIIPILYNFILKKDYIFFVTLDDSVWIILLMATIYVLVNKYWEKVPKNISLDKIVFRKFQNYYRIAALMLGMFILIAICMKSRENISEVLFMSQFEQFANIVKVSILQCEGTVWQVGNSYSIIGIIIYIVSNTFIIIKIRKNYRKDDKTIILSYISIMFLMQSLFYRQQLVTTPFYMIILIYTLFNKSTLIEHSESKDKVVN